MPPSFLFDEDIGPAAKPVIWPYAVRLPTVFDEPDQPSLVFAVPQEEFGALTNPVVWDALHCYSSGLATYFIEHGPYEDPEPTALVFAVPNEEFGQLAKPIIWHNPRIGWHGLGVTSFFPHMPWEDPYHPSLKKGVPDDITNRVLFGPPVIAWPHQPRQPFRDDSDKPTAGRPQTTTNAVLLGTVIQTAALAANLSKTILSTTSVDAVRKKTLTTTVGLIGSLKAASNTQQCYVSALLAPPVFSIATAATTSAVLFSSGQLLTHTCDAALVVATITSTITTGTDALLFAGGVRAMVGVSAVLDGPATNPIPFSIFQARSSRR